MFCPPWERCIEGHCSCKPPYLCPSEGARPVCGLDHRTYRSYCQVTRLIALNDLADFSRPTCSRSRRWSVFQVMAVSCQTKRSRMSHFGENCKGSLPLTHPELHSMLDTTPPLMVHVCLHPSVPTEDQPKFNSTILSGTAAVKIFLPDARSPGGGEELLVCQRLWNIAAANVACKAGGTPL